MKKIALFVIVYRMDRVEWNIRLFYDFCRNVLFFKSSVEICIKFVFVDSFVHLFFSFFFSFHVEPKVVIISKVKRWYPLLRTQRQFRGNVLVILFFHPSFWFLINRTPLKFPDQVRQAFWSAYLPRSFLG